MKKALLIAALLAIGGASAWWINGQLNKEPERIPQVSFPDPIPLDRQIASEKK